MAIRSSFSYFLTSGPVSFFVFLIWGHFCFEGVWPKQSGPWPKKIPPPSPLKSRFLKKIFYNLVFLISSRAQTGAVHTNSTRRIFLNRSQGFLTSFLGVKADWKSYFENYKKKGARSSAPDRWILCKIGRGIVWEGSRTPEISFGKGPGPQKLKKHWKIWEIFGNPKNPKNINFQISYSPNSRSTAIGRPVLVI